jgi:hypothetical protein
LYVFNGGEFSSYTPLTKDIQEVGDLEALLVSNQENFPVYLINQN